MPNFQQIEVIHARLEEIDVAIRNTRNFVDQQAYLEMPEGGRTLMTLEQLIGEHEKETQKLRDAANQ